MKLIFTDLDGTLLDHDTYSFDKAREAIAFCKQNKIPIIINTSKTKEEVVDLRNKIDILDSPFIVENGGGVYFPKSFPVESGIEKDGMYLLSLGLPYQKILEFFNIAKEKYSIFGFNQMTLEEISHHTGLGLDDSKKAKSRDFTEPFILKDPKQLDDLTKDGKKYGISITKGGRFYHLISEKQDKGLALLKTKEVYEKALGQKFETVGLGDGKNDYPMLKVCDYPVLIPTHSGNYENTDIKNHIKAKHKSSQGWNETIKGIFNV